MPRESREPLLFPVCCLTRVFWCWGWDLVDFLYSGILICRRCNCITLSPGIRPVLLLSLESREPLLSACVPSKIFIGSVPAFSGFPPSPQNLIFQRKIGIVLDGCPSRDFSQLVAAGGFGVNRPSSIACCPSSSLAPTYFQPFVLRRTSTHLTSFISCGLYLCK